jgi:predicted ATP-dependent serine protease
MSQKTNSKNFSVKTMNELAEAGKSIPEPKRLLGDFIIENSLVHFPSERGTGKTFFAVQICLAISNEATSFVGERIEMHGNTLYINCELSEDTFSSRLCKLYQNPPFPINTNGKYIAKVITTRDTFAVKKDEIVKQIHELKPKLVVLDNWKTAFSNIETAKETGEAMMELLDLKDEYRFAFLIVDHTKKGTKIQLTDSDLQSGSGTKSDLADSDFFLRKSTQDPCFRILKRIKSRYSVDQMGAKLLEFDMTSLWFECHSENVNEIDHLDVSAMRTDTESIHRMICDIYSNGQINGQTKTTMEGIAKMFNMSKSNVSLIINKNKEKV